MSSTAQLCLWLYISTLWCHSVYVPCQLSLPFSYINRNTQGMVHTEIYVCVYIVFVWCVVCACVCRSRSIKMLTVLSQSNIKIKCTCDFIVENRFHIQYCFYIHAHIPVILQNLDFFYTSDTYSFKSRLLVRHWYLFFFCIITFRGKQLTRACSLNIPPTAGLRLVCWFRLTTGHSQTHQSCVFWSHTILT